MPILPLSALHNLPIFYNARSSSRSAVPASALWIIYICPCSSAMCWDNLI